MNAANPTEMHLFEHLRELRKRLLFIALGLLAASTAAYSFSGEIFALLAAPYNAQFPNQMLIGTGPAEAFLLKIKVALFAGAIVSSPFTFLQFWLFIAPGLYDNERKLVIPFVISTSALFLFGVYFCYTAVVPVAFSFFADEYRSVGITPAIRMSEHLTVLTQALLGFGAVFEMPVLAFFLARVGLITHRTLIDGGRYAIVIIFIVSAILTPPDVLSQFLMAIPLLLLYALSILIVRITQPKRE